MTPAEFFKPFLNRSALFNHVWQLVGRSDHIRQAHEFIESQQGNVGILVGRGGIGKTKILHALAEVFDREHKGMSLWFLAEGVPLSEDGTDYLPYKPCVVVVDDAHRRSDLPILLALSRQREHTTKLILSCRPQGIGYLKTQLTEGGFDVREISELPDVKELSHGEVTELGRQALGAEFAGLAEQLSAATWDCPLVTVVGGQLLAKKAIPPDLLERDDEFRDAVLTRFRDVLVGEVGDRIDTELCRSLLDLIAAVQPIRLDNERTLDSEAEFLAIDRPGLLRSLGALEEAGVLLRRGHTLRIVPDVLADHILHRASVMPQGQSTGYADLVFNSFASLCPSEVLRNLSELDWRLRQSSAPASDLLGGIWNSIEQEFQNASNQGRCTILGVLEEVAVYLPEKTLQLVEYAIRNPATKAEDAELSKVYEFTHSDVLGKLPTLLRRISYTLDFLPRCIYLLWELGRDDGRALNPNPDHAMRVLADLANYDIGKPLAVNHLILDAFQKLLEARGSHDHVHSPLDIIDPMLAKTGYSSRSEGHKFVFRPFTLKRESIESIRQRSISLVVGCLYSHNPRARLRALDSLGNALREPIGAFGHEISDKDREQWRPEQLELLTHIADLAKRSTEPLALLRIKKILWWQRNYGPSDDIRGKAGAIVASIPDSFELRLTNELMDPYRWEDLLPEDREGDDGYGRRQERIEQARRILVAEFLSHYDDVGKANGVLTERIQAITEAGVRPEPQEFLDVLGASDPELANGLCEVIIDDPSGKLSPYLHALLSNVRTWNAERVRAIGQRAIEGGSNILCRGVALSYQRWGSTGDASAQDVENIRALLNHKDTETRGVAIRSLGFLAKADQRVAIDLGKNVVLGDSYVLARELCQLFHGGWGLSFVELTADDLKAFLLKLEEVPDIDDFYINAFLISASHLDAGAVVGFLLNRIRRQHSETGRYDALPVLGFKDPLTGLSASPDQERILRELRDTSLEPGWSVKFWVPQLFREVSSDFGSDASLKVLNEWINSGDAHRIKSAAHLLEGAPPMFVFKQTEFVSNLLECAHAESLDCYLSVTGSLASCTLSGSRSGTPGQPMPQDVAMKNQASEIANKFDAGSATHGFYMLLAESAETSIRDQLLRDEEFYE